MIEEITRLVEAENVEELIAEDYLSKLLEGNELKFEVYKEIGKLNGCMHISFDLNARLQHIYETICEEIKCCNLNLTFEYEPEMWKLSPEEDIHCDRFKDEFCTYKDSGLLLHDYKPCFHKGRRCAQFGGATIHLKINGSKIECTKL